MARRIAVASTDGENIDLHFAQAHQFYIYDISDRHARFVEVRHGARTAVHDEQAFERTLQLLHDCTETQAQVQLRIPRNISFRCGP